MKLQPVNTLGKSLEELKDHLGISETGELTDVLGDGELWVYRKSGLAARLSDGCVTTVYLYSDGYDGFAGFQGDTGGIRLDSSKQVIRFKLGYPTRHREGEFEPVLGTIPNFDRYDYEDHSLHFQYDEAGKQLRMLTIMSPDVVRHIEGESRVKPDRPVVYDKAKYHSESVLEYELPEEQAAVHTAFFLGWLIDNDLCSAEFVEDTQAEIAAYKQREKTALEIYGEWDYCLVDDMLNDEGNAFAQSYFDFSTGEYIGDFLEILVRKLPSEFHVPYTWKNQKKISHKISKRYSVWKEPERSRSPRPDRMPRRKKVSQPQPAGKQEPAEKAPLKLPPVRRTKKPEQGSARLLWLFKFVIFPIFAVATGLAIIIYADTL